MHISKLEDNKTAAGEPHVIDLLITFEFTFVRSVILTCTPLKCTYLPFLALSAEIIRSPLISQL